MRRFMDELSLSYESIVTTFIYKKSRIHHTTENVIVSFNFVTEEYIPHLVYH